MKVSIYKLIIRRILKLEYKKYAMINNNVYNLLLLLHIYFALINIKQFINIFYNNKI